MAPDTCKVAQEIPFCSELQWALWTLAVSATENSFLNDTESSTTTFNWKNRDWEGFRDIQVK